MGVTEKMIGIVEAIKGAGCFCWWNDRMGNR